MQINLELLKQFGLTDNETKIYLANLEVGPSSVQNLAKKSGVKRTTIYSTLESLASKGLISQTQRGKKTSWVAENPESLINLIEQRTQALKKALPELRSIYNIPGAKPKVRFYEGRDGFITVYANILKDNPKELLVISSYDNFCLHVDSDYETEWTEKRIKQKMQLRWLDFKTPLTEKMRQEGGRSLREIRFLPDQFKFISAVFIYQGKIIMVSGEQKEFTAVVVENDEFYQTFKQIFEMLWLQAK